MSPAERGPEPSPTAAAAVRALPPGVWVLGLVSLFMDSSSELVHSLLPVLMADVLGASIVTIGVIEGVAEATAAITKVFSGVLSDHLRKRKTLVVLGYGLGALAKPVFPLAARIGWVFGARFVDRIGKGIRGAPRDALIADLVPGRRRGAAYGLRQALDSVGAFLGPLLAVTFMAWLDDDLRAVLWLATAPAVVAVVLLALGVREPEGTARSAPREARRLDLAGVRRLPAAFWPVVALGAVFTLARFSEAFLVLRGQDVGVRLGRVPAILVVMNVAYAGLSLPAGIAADRVSRRVLLAAGLGVLVAADLVLALAASPTGAFVGAGLWGVHMALTQGLLATLVADSVPADLRGTAFGLFNLVGGVALLAASVLAGELWSAVGAPATFAVGAGFATLAVLGVLHHRPRRPAVGARTPR